MKCNIRLLLEYNGAAFKGWQKQPAQRTIQEELEKTLKTVLRSDISPLYAAGRTDAGVHARGQVVNFFLEGEEGGLPDLSILKHSVSHILKGEVSVLAAEFVPLDFNSRYSAKRKQYTYTILWRDVPAVLDRGRAWHVTSRLDLDSMVNAAQALIGRHDFTSLRGAKCTALSPVKEILESEFIVEPPYIRYRVVAKSFLKQMVRNIVGTLVWMGKGKVRKTMPQIIDARDRRAAGVTAPAYGLCLDWVEY